MKKTTVVDTSAILAVVLGEAQKRRLEERTRGLDLIAPLSLKWEIGNALSAMFKRKIITLRESVMMTVFTFSQARSPLAVRGLKTKITAKEIVDIIREVRERN